MSAAPEAFFSEKHRCWFVPVSVDLMTSPSIEKGVEPARVQLKDGWLWITELEKAET